MSSHNPLSGPCCFLPLPPLKASWRRRRVWRIQLSDSCDFFFFLTFKNKDIFLHNRRPISKCWKHNIDTILFDTQSIFHFTLNLKTAFKAIPRSPRLDLSLSGLSSLLLRHWLYWVSVIMSSLSTSHPSTPSLSWVA